MGTLDARRRAEEQAAAYFARLTGGADEAERQAIFDWVDADPRHAVAFARMQAAWEVAERLKASPPSLDTPQQTEVSNPRAAPQRRQVMAGLITAGVAGIAVATGSWIWLRPETYQTRTGERRIVVLSDGSKVHLNTATRVEVVMAKSERQIKLAAGEALFEVAHDPARPFYVDADGARMTAVGTAFNVRLRQEMVELTVTEGIVSVAPTVTAKVERVNLPCISAGGGAVIRSGSVAETPLTDDALEQRTAWREGAIEFRGETLGRVVKEFNRYRTQPIVIANDRLADLRVGGRFQVDDADKFLVALKSSFPVDTIRANDGSTLIVSRTQDSSVPG